MRILLRNAACVGVGCAVLVLANGCATPPQRGSTLESRLIAEVDTVALAPVGAAPDALSDAEARRLFEKRATERLEQVGFRVVPGKVYDRMWARYADEVGGVYDESTGEADDARLEIVRDAVYRELSEVHGVDAVLALRVVVVDSPGINAHPTGVGYSPIVCGRKVPIYWPGGWDSQWGEFATLLRSACLSAQLFGTGGYSIFSRRHLLESLETYDRQSRAVRPRKQRFMRERVLDIAVASVLKPLILDRSPQK